MRFSFAAMAAPLLAAGWLRAATAPSAEGLELFEKKVQPIFVETCYKCHSHAERKSRGGLVVDSRAGLLTFRRPLYTGGYNPWSMRAWPGGFAEAALGAFERVFHLDLHIPVAPQHDLAQFRDARAAAVGIGAGERKRSGVGFGQDARAADRTAHGQGGGIGDVERAACGIQRRGTRGGEGRRRGEADVDVARAEQQPVPPLDDAWTWWRAVTKAADPYLDTLEGTALTRPWKREPRHSETPGTKLHRTTYHYWFHLGESQAIRQMLGDAKLPDFVGSFRNHQYQPEP